MDQTLPVIDAVARFTLDPAPMIPDSARETAAMLLIDTVAVAAGAAALDAGRIARETALALYGSGSADWQARIMFDGRRASLAGAAFAAASQIDNLDAHDGLNSTKGHIGCAVVPTIFACAERLPALTAREALDAMVIGYEVSARAAVALHATVSDYHTSGAWNALGVAAVACRLLGGDTQALRHALGIAEYHGPRSQMMREIDNPTMLHDGSGIGALTGMTAAVMALKGFHGAPAITVTAPEVAHLWADLGSDWTIERNYIKPYPVCRWAHAAIDAVAALQAEHGFSAEEVASVQIRSFAEAVRLFAGMPDTTSRAQYSLPFAVATMLVHGRIGPQHVAGDGLSDPAVAALLPLISAAVDPAHDTAFPAHRRADVVVTLRGGQRFEAFCVDARGGPEAPLSRDECAGKIRDFAAPTLGVERAEALLASRDTLLSPGAMFAGLMDLVLHPAGHRHTGVGC
ncbi:MAG: MmgE/PrpD family protein [Pseudomonadota bacterium]